MFKLLLNLYISMVIYQIKLLNVEYGYFINRDKERMYFIKFLF